MIDFATAIIFIVCAECNARANIAMHKGNTIRFILNITILVAGIVGMNAWYHFGAKEWVFVVLGIGCGSMIYYGICSVIRYFKRKRDFKKTIIKNMCNQITIMEDKLKLMMQDETVLQYYMQKYPDVVNAEFVESYKVLRKSGLAVSYLYGSWIILDIAHNDRLTACLEKNHDYSDRGAYICSGEKVKSICRDITLMFM